MLTVLEPYAVYIFAKLNGVIATSLILARIPIRENQLFTDVVNNYEPAKMKYRSDVTPLLRALDQKEKEGWRLTSWHISHLSPAENKPGEYEDAVKIRIIDEH